MRFEAFKSSVLSKVGELTLRLIFFRGGHVVRV